MRKYRRFHDIFRVSYLIPVIFAIVLTGCSAGNDPLTGSVSAIAFAGAIPKATVPVTVTLTPTATLIPGETGVDDLDAATNPEPSAPASPLIADDKSGQVGAASAGIQIYRENYCGSCHALAAAETTGAFGPAHNQAGLVAEVRLQDANYTGNATTTAEYIEESLLDPTAHLVPGYEVTYMKMPPFTHLNEEDIDALVALLLDQK